MRVVRVCRITGDVFNVRGIKKKKKKKNHDREDATFEI